MPATVRETVETLRKLNAECDEPSTIAELAGELGLDKSAAWRRVRSAMDRGYVRNLEDQKGRPARLVPGDALPDDMEILPEPERLRGCTVADDPEGTKTNDTSAAHDFGTAKVFPATSPNESASVLPLRRTAGGEVRA